MVEMVDESAALLSKMPTLEKYGTNLGKLAKEGKLDHVVERVAQFPGGLTKTNPETIDGKKMFTGDMGRERRLKKLIKLSDVIILLIDEFDDLMGAQVGEGAIDAA
ncbi:unnamed protein product [Lactuca virosa]|uniref:ATPase AAA-type core domain-containing protein n=1 Tax=Lactuca virosa TaxID=75947 RepID=A0AAU9LZF8_9ASTR|nr:unnamed protein product [Lactuca virosa]